MNASRIAGFFPAADAMQRFHDLLARSHQRTRRIRFAIGGIVIGQIFSGTAAVVVGWSGVAAALRGDSVLAAIMIAEMMIFAAALIVGLPLVIHGLALLREESASRQRLIRFIAVLDVLPAAAHPETQSS